MSRFTSWEKEKKVKVGKKKKKRKGKRRECLFVMIKREGEKDGERMRDERGEGKKEI